MHNPAPMRVAVALALALALTARAAHAGAAPEPPWPCRDCVVHVPKKVPEGPRPLLVALHGDGGAVRPLVRAWQAACDRAGVILLAPRCPVDRGCPSGSWWQWIPRAGHDDGWLPGLVDAVAERHPIDRAQVFATGYSGGATYLGYWTPRHPRYFGAVAHVAGGARFWTPCPACKVPVRFTLGATDPMIGLYTDELRAYYAACEGHELVWEILPGVTHESILGVLQSGRAHDLLAWLLARPAACAAEIPDAGADAALVEDAAPPPPPVEAASPPAVDRPPALPPRASCACGAGAGEERGGAAFAAALLLAIGRRRRRATSA